MGSLEGVVIEGEKWRDKRICVVGAGPAGLVTAKELLSNGFSHIVVYEQRHELGGTWLYDKQSSLQQDNDTISASQTHRHWSGIYESLRLRSSREIMGFQDFPFQVVKGGDSRRFPLHYELLHYLNEFAQHNTLHPFISFNTVVQQITFLSPSPSPNCQWLVTTLNLSSKSVTRHVFDAVVVCTGHYSYPRLPDIQGLSEWPGRHIHSHDYQVPYPFKDEVVLVIGNGHSGQDISVELLSVAKEVHMSAKLSTLTEALFKLQDLYPNFYVHSLVKSLQLDGLVVFEDGTYVSANSIIHCTGYCYSFPFLETKGIVSVDDNRVGPLFEHTFPPLLAPSLSFVGIPRKILAFPFFESQARWISLVLSGKRQLPSIEEMMRSVNEYYKTMEENGVPKHATHDIANFEYYDKLADYSGYPHIEEWKKEICIASIQKSENDLEGFRDFPEDQDLVDVAISIDPHVRSCFGI